MHQSFSTSLALQVASRRWRRCVLQDRVSLFFGLPSFCFLFCFLVALANEFTPRPGLWPRPVLGGFGGRWQESVGMRGTFGPDHTPAAAHPKVRRRTKPGVVFVLGGFCSMFLFGGYLDLGCVCLCSFLIKKGHFFHRDHPNFGSAMGSAF